MWSVIDCSGPLNNSISVPTECKTTGVCVCVWFDEIIAGISCLPDIRLLIYIGRQYIFNPQPQDTHNHTYTYIDIDFLSDHIDYTVAHT